MSKRKVYKYALLLADLIACYLMYLLCEFVMSEFNPHYTSQFQMFALCFTIIKCFAHFVFGDYELLWLYQMKNNFIKFLLVAFIVNINFMGFSILMSWMNYQTVSIPTLTAYLSVEACYIFASRFGVNFFFENIYYKTDVNKSKKRTLVVGAGAAGSLILSEFGLNKMSPYKVVAFIDDSLDKGGTKVNNIKIYSPINKINEVIEELHIDEVIIAMPSVPKSRIQEIVNLINYKNVLVHIVPDKTKLLEGSLTEKLRKVSINDLLGREMVKLDTTGLTDFLENKVVLVTGGSGSIGSEICRQVLNYHVKTLVVFDIYENTTYQLEVELKDHFRKLKQAMPHIEFLIGSVRDEARLDAIFNEYHPGIVFHAAAHKHVPLMEDSPKEAIKNNIIGTYNVCKVCDKYHVNKMVMISTDKAVNPTNIMGTSKRFAEMVIEAWNMRSKHTLYSMVRFGNVLGSNGSVIPLFERQIKEGGPLTVTSEEVTRFFMTIPEACGLVIQSGAYALGGEKFILDMGKPVKIIDLAKNMIRLSGLELGKNIDIEVIGLRPGEKMYEELLLDTTKASKTANEKIFVEKTLYPFPLEEMDKIITHLLSIAESGNEIILSYLRDIEKVKKTMVLTEVRKI